MWVQRWVHGHENNSEFARILMLLTASRINALETPSKQRMIRDGAQGAPHNLEEVKQERNALNL
jgi:hypothetical protein